MKQKDLVIILVPLLILTILWVIFNVYHNYVSSTITDPLSYQIVPIEGSFDKNTIEQVKQRNRIDPSNEIIVEISGSPTPTPINLLINDASNSANIDEDQEEEE